MLPVGGRNRPTAAFIPASKASQCVGGHGVGESARLVNGGRRAAAYRAPVWVAGLPGEEGAAVGCAAGPRVSDASAPTSARPAPVSMAYL